MLASADGCKHLSSGCICRVCCLHWCFDQVHALVQIRRPASAVCRFGYLMLWGLQDQELRLRLSFQKPQSLRLCGSLSVSAWHHGFLDHLGAESGQAGDRSKSFRPYAAVRPGCCLKLLSGVGSKWHVVLSSLSSPTLIEAAAAMRS